MFSPLLTSAHQSNSLFALHIPSGQSCRKHIHKARSAEDSLEVGAQRRAGHSGRSTSGLWKRRARPAPGSCQAALARSCPRGNLDGCLQVKAFRNGSAGGKKPLAPKREKRLQNQEEQVYELSSTYRATASRKVVGKRGVLSRVSPHGASKTSSGSLEPFGPRFRQLPFILLALH